MSVQSCVRLGVSLQHIKQNKKINSKKKKKKTKTKKTKKKKH